MPVIPFVGLISSGGIQCRKSTHPQLSSLFLLPLLPPPLSLLGPPTPFSSLPPLFLFLASIRAVFPDVPEKILPADGTKSVGMLFSNVLREDGKSQNFVVYMVWIVVY